MSRRPQLRVLGTVASSGAIVAALLVACPRSAHERVQPSSPGGDSTAVVRVDDGSRTSTPRRVEAAPAAIWRLALPDLGIETLPTALAAGAGRVYLSSANGVVMALAASTRQRAWLTAASETNLLPRRLVSTRGERLIVFGGPTDSMTVIDAGTGRVVRRWPTRAFLQGGCELPDGSAMFASLDSVALLTVDAAGVLRRGARLPWRRFDNAHPLQRQVILAGDGAGTCVAALAVGQGFATYRDGLLARLSPYAEHVTTPDVMVAVRSQGAGSRVISSQLMSREVAARDVAVMDGVVYVAFEGRSRLAGRVIDRFHAATGRYLGSLEFATEVRRIAVADGCLYVTTYEQGVPTLACYPGVSARRR